ncbi:hypothetical protein [Rhodococcus chondri]|uniref:Uncharacterized protein n=1 Tax=Rhodococcus chondri TaxID=3065941 RepID=A0ABU7JQ88_9NOCA|nr:hypothetical protein [Rhodococcus sp. CC-R104]MEE2032196.1 hypothetical protein [Rhodococcus sp. CC-R104]
MNNRQEREDQEREDFDNLDDDTKRRAEERADEIQKMYEPGARPTTTVPGTGGMVSGTAFADFADQPEGTVDEGTGEDEPGGDARR